jgi:2-alkyl-3-oxoalkanoate reductase
MKALVTGGGGFLGSAIVRLLVERGDDVRSFSRGEYPDLTRLGVSQFRGDLLDTDALDRAAAGCDIIFHVAAKAGIWGRYADFYRTNVNGTENVIAVCLRNGIDRLVYTGSPSVVFDGKDVEGGDESLPYPPRYDADYPKTKAMAEKLVLAASSPRFATVSLRPHLIWGPGDNHLVPRILARGKAGKLRRIGSRPCMVDTIYVENAAMAHLLAADRLLPGGNISGRSYFISNGEPIPLWEMVDRILAAAGLPPVKGSVPATAALAAGAILETIWRILGLPDEPPMTRFVAREMATAHWFDISAARRDIGYHPEISIDEGLKRLENWLSGGSNEK